MAKQTVVLVILDGWGVGRGDASNPIHVVNPPNINHIKKTYPMGSLQASGIAVGLPWNEEGNSEVGHLTLGAGKVIYQHFPRISLSIKDGSFFKNQAFLDAFAHAKKNNSRVHLVGLLTDSGVHAHLDHIQALLKLAENENFSNVSLHLFTDGKDTPPKSAIKFISQVPQERIASISGRFFAMDRDLHWDRTARVYNTLVSSKQQVVSSKGIEEFLKSSYECGLTDDFIEPTLFRAENVIKDNDSVIFFNFREDAMRQLAEMFTNPRAGEEHIIPNNLHITAFTEYSSQFNLPVAFPTEKVINPLGKILSDNNKVQLRIAETEKYAHVTYFFNGYEEKPFKNEYRVLIPSRNIARQDEAPEMMASQITTRVVSALNEGVYDFILVNYANPDVIAH
ncbi:MAG: 2,3-bisphosphoglycerate-independent phosphoglycerate mutase, partial [Candidatus Colwellbacteria bacterium]|nr:2,3-bisphosphoglycerate-independent phosphoglycerate mutase [Candidatus Colwellbacteria bacterium]